jgi:hypothetical protein
MQPKQAGLEIERGWYAVQSGRRDTAMFRWEVGADSPAISPGAGRSTAIKNPATRS